MCQALGLVLLTLRKMGVASHLPDCLHAAFKVDHKLLRFWKVTESEMSKLYGCSFSQFWHVARGSWTQSSASHGCSYSQKSRPLKQGGITKRSRRKTRKQWRSSSHSWNLFQLEQCFWSFFITKPSAHLDPSNVPHSSSQPQCTWQCLSSGYLRNSCSKRRDTLPPFM